MTEVQNRIAQAVLEVGKGPTVGNSFSPFIDLLREFAEQQRIAFFSTACSQMFSSDRHNQWHIREHAPKILLSTYLPKVLESHHLSWCVLITNAGKWAEQLATVLENSTGLQSVLDVIVAEIKKSALASPC